MQRILTIQDISCVGKCSLTVALPIISAMGVEASVIPTALLSTHTAFKDFAFKDLTQEINPIINHLLKEGFKFHSVYSGYLGSKEQIQIVSHVFEQFKKRGSKTIVDPVMADNGKLYSGFTNDFVLEMKKLCSKADIIIPNMTEASLLLGIEYKNSGYDETYIKNILKGLSELGAKQVVLTGVSFHENELGIMAYNSITDEYFSYFREKINANYHGTGDIFSSTCVGALANNFDLQDALKIAVNYTVESIKTTINDESSNWYGVNFEKVIPYLIKEIEKEKQLCKL